ncbi:hypothetical protein GCM10023196_042530 [Actinoallomurus vinaceus]|uniref:SMI1/KNR4 family protein n=1 Tax=Actinoallomurus vinaceus TaxID=1080074 RepID=A0ABP8UAW4_9ACTN
MMNPDEESYSFPFEERCARTLGEIRHSSGLIVSEALFGAIHGPIDDFEFVFKSLAEDDGLPFSPAVQRYFFRCGEIAAQWQSPDPDFELAGEFHLTHLYITSLMSHTWEGSDNWERDLYRELRVFDDTPRTGTGYLAALRAAHGTTDPEIWFFDMHRGVMEMDLDYGTYLDTLLVTKGTIGWQYLFCDTGMPDPGFAPVAKGLKEMLEVFPQLFPDHDYADLRARLRERT